LAGRKPLLLVTDPPYGIGLDSEWRDRAGLNGCGPAEPSYLERTEGHRNTSISSDTRADWSDAFALVPSLEVAYVARLEVHPRGSGGPAADWICPSSADHLEQGAHGSHQDPLLVPTRAMLVGQKKSESWYGRPGENSETRPVGIPRVQREGRSLGLSRQ
jgi:hypothetical protein